MSYEQNQSPPQHTSTPVKPENFFGDGSESAGATFLGEVICPPGEIFAWTTVFFFGVVEVLEASSVKQDHRCDTVRHCETWNTLLQQFPNFLAL